MSRRRGSHPALAGRGQDHDHRRRERRHPDTAVSASATVEREADTGEAARAAAADVAAEMRAALRDAGVPDASVSTESFAVHAQYDHRDGYRAVHAYRIEVTPDRAGEVGGVAVGNGADRVSGVAFYLSEEKRADLRQEALTLAVENARTDAETMAAAAGVSVGEVHSLSILNSGSPVYPVYGAAEDSADGGTVVGPGEVSVSASVSVEYGIAE